ncbi:hypothetical protein LINGRAHAP2_LOCUS11751, partial [Linum grandiflorum]
MGTPLSLSGRNLPDLSARFFRRLESIDGTSPFRRLLTSRLLLSSNQRRLVIRTRMTGRDEMTVECVISAGL